MSPLVRQATLWVVAATTAVSVTWVGLGLVTDQVVPPATIEFAGAAPEPLPTDAPSTSDDGTLAPSPGPDSPTTEVVAAPSVSEDPEDPEESEEATGRASSSPDRSSSGPTGPTSSNSSSEPDDDDHGSSPDDPTSDDDATSEDESEDESDEDEKDEPSDDESEEDETEKPSDDDSDDDSEAGLDQQRTVTTTGGTVRFRFTDGRVDVVSSPQPRAGFTAEVERRGPDEVRVTFSSEDHESRIDADIDDGEPRVEVREESDD